MRRKSGSTVYLPPMFSLSLSQFHQKYTLRSVFEVRQSTTRRIATRACGIIWARQWTLSALSHSPPCRRLSRATTFLVFSSTYPPYRLLLVRITAEERRRHFYRHSLFTTRSTCFSRTLPLSSSSSISLALSFSPPPIPDPICTCFSFSSTSFSISHHRDCRPCPLKSATAIIRRALKRASFYKRWTLSKDFWSTKEPTEKKGREQERRRVWWEAEYFMRTEERR